MKAVSNTSPLIFLNATGLLSSLSALFEELLVPSDVVVELRAGEGEGYPVPELAAMSFIRIVEPRHPPSEWLALDLGPGELAAMSLALEHPTHVVLLDDALARRVAEAAGLRVWGTLRILLEAKSHGIIDAVAPRLSLLVDAGMWLSEDVRRRVLRLAGE